MHIPAGQQAFLSAPSEGESFDTQFPVFHTYGPIIPAICANV